MFAVSDFFYVCSNDYYVKPGLFNDPTMPGFLQFRAVGLDSLLLSFHALQPPHLSNNPNMIFGHLVRYL